ncbi:MAG: hypothetical protein PHH16_03585 [Candidatus Gracilibacteria bacterium]|nr:hypothetical protein [Candidatus Gracilibacteria bacterium]
MILSKLFGSNCRAKILEKFFIEHSVSSDTTGIFIRELCRDIDEQINSVRRELMNLETLGILKSREENKKKFYNINRSCAIYEELSDIFIKTYNPIEPLKAFFKGKRNLSLITIADSIKQLTNIKSNNIVDIFIIGELDKIEFNNFLEKTFFRRKVKYAVMSEEDFINRLEYDDKLVLSILSQKNISFLKDSLNIQEIISKKIEK